MSKIKERREDKQEVKYLQKQKKELERIISEIEQVNTKVISTDKINEIVRGRQGRLEDAKELEKEVHSYNLNKVKLNSIKLGIVTLNIGILLLPYALIGIPSYAIMEHLDKSPYHQNNNKHYSYITEYRNNLDEDYELDEEQIKEFGKNTLKISSPWEEKNDGYVRSIFIKEDYDDMTPEEVLNTNATDIIAKNDFDEIKTVSEDKLDEKSLENNDFLIEISSTTKDEENYELKENSVEDILGYSSLHLSLTAFLGTGIYLFLKKIIMKDRLVLEKNLNCTKDKLDNMTSKETINNKKQKIKELRKK